jgi:hypothetical protein
MRSAGRQVDFLDGVFFNRESGHVEKYRDGRLVTHFRAGLCPPLAKRLGMDAPANTYPDLPTNVAQANTDR